MTYDWTKVSRATLERVMGTMYDLCAAINDPKGCPDPMPLMQARINAFDAALVEAHVPHLRTRSEVDADIANAVRKGFAEGAKFGSGTGNVSHHYACILWELVQERTGE